jgi:hypothetical protein
MNIGTEKGTIVVEPLEEPVPKQVPQEEPREPEPVK